MKEPKLNDRCPGHQDRLVKDCYYNLGVIDAKESGRKSSLLCEHCFNIDKTPMTNQPNNWKEVYPIEWDEENDTVMLNGICINDYEDVKKAVEDFNFVINKLLKSELQKQADKYEGIISDMIGQEHEEESVPLEFAKGFNYKRQELILIANSYNIDLK